MKKNLNIKYVQSQNEDKQKFIGAILDEKLIGFLRYKIKRDQAWLYNVEVFREFRHLKNEQIGSNLMRIFENDCHSSSVWCIEGKYWPKGEEGAVVKRFYDRNGYKIEREDYDLIVYKLSPSKTELPFEIETIEYDKFDVIFEEFIQKIDECELEND